MKRRKKSSEIQTVKFVTCPNCQSAVMAGPIEQAILRNLRGPAYGLRHQYVCVGPEHHQFDQWEISDEVLVMLMKEQMVIANFTRAFRMTIDIANKISTDAEAKTPNGEMR